MSALRVARVPHLKYVESKLVEDVLCSVCTEPFLEPTMHQSCGNVFCTSCICSLDSCPLCRSPLKDKLQDVPRMVKNRLNALKIYCPACQATIERGNLQQHLQACAAEISKCAASPMCSWCGPRSDLAQHHSGCAFYAMQPVLDGLRERVAVLEAEQKRLQLQISSAQTVRPIRTDGLHVFLYVDTNHQRDDRWILFTTQTEALVGISTSSFSTPIGQGAKYSVTQRKNGLWIRSVTKCTYEVGVLIERSPTLSLGKGRGFSRSCQGFLTQ